MKKLLRVLAIGVLLAAGAGALVWYKMGTPDAVNPYVQPALPAGYRPTLEIAVPTVPPGDGKTVLYPSAPGPFVLVKTDLWNLQTREKIAGVPGIDTYRTIDALSPDGKHLAVDTGGLAVVLEMATGRKVLEVPYDKGQGNLNFLDFAGTDRLVMSVSTAPTARIEVWNLLQARKEREFDAPRFAAKGGAVSPDGTRLSGFTVDEMTVHDLSTGKPAWSWQRPAGKHKSLLVASGISYSPDGKELAVHCGMGDVHHLLIWNAVTGKLTGELEFPALAGGLAHAGRDVLWLPEGDGWLLEGHFLVQRDLGRIVWMLQTGLVGQHSVGVVDRQHVLAPSWQKDKHALISVPVPWADIDSAIAALRGQQSAPVRPGQAVSLDIDVGKAAGNAAGQFKTELAKVLTERLAIDGVTVADDQPTVLYARYSEVSGQTLKVYDWGMMQPKAETGRTATETKMALELGLRKADGKILWQTFVSQGAGLFISGQGTTADLHKDTFDALKRKLRALPLPYFVPADESTRRLPIVSQL